MAIDRINRRRRAAARRLADERRRRAAGRRERVEWALQRTGGVISARTRRPTGAGAERERPSSFEHDFTVTDTYLARLRDMAIAERDRLSDVRINVGAAMSYEGPNGEVISGGFQGQGGTVFLDPSPDFSPNAVIFTTLDGMDIYWSDVLAEAQANGGMLTHPVSRQNFRFHNEMSLAQLRELYRTHDAEYVGNQPILPDIGGGGGGGGGRAGPSYVMADQLLVKEVVQGYVAATTGKVHQDLIDAGIKVYNENHRRGFDLRESQEVDPMAAVRELVRADKRYTSAHTLRPENFNELEWVTARQQALSSMGVAAGSEEDLGITLARMGAGGTGVRAAAESQIFADSGRLAKSQRDSLVKSASAALRLI